MADLRIETERLILRPPKADDFPGWAEMMADEDASHFIGGPLDEISAWASMSVMAGSWMLQGFGNFSVIEKETGSWIGRVGPWSPPGWPGHEIGWALHRNHWGRGYAFEAAMATMAWARDALGWRDIIHIIHPDNLRSIALAQKVGSKYSHHLNAGALRNEVPVLVFAQTLD